MHDAPFVIAGSSPKRVPLLLSSVKAHQQLGTLVGAVTLDLLPSLGHGIDDRVLQIVIRHLS